MFLLTGIILLYTSHALFTAPTVEKSAITIKAGTMNPTIKVDGVVTNELTVAAGEEKVFTVTFENLNPITGKFYFYYIGSTNALMGYLAGTGLDVPSASSFLLSSGNKKTYSIKVKNLSPSSQTITLGGIGGLESPSLTMPSGAKVIPLYCYTFNTSSQKITDYWEDESCPKDIVIPNTINGVNVTSIGDFAFYNNQLTSVTIPNRVTTIGYKAFEKNQLTSVTIPDNVITIGESAFNRNQLTSVTIGKNVTSIGDYAFGSNKLTSVEIPDSVKYLSGFGSNSLVSITIPKNVTTIGKQAFEYTKLTSVEIPDSVEIIESSAFDGNKLTSIIIPDNVTKIGDGAFAYNQLTSVIIPNKVKYLSGFDGNDLTSIIIPNSVTTIGNDAFYGNKLTNISIPSSVTSIGIGAFHNNQLPDNQAFIYNRNSDGSIDYTSLNSYGGAKRDNIVIPNTVVSIGDSAFSFTHITSILIPSGVTTIGDSAFLSSNLTSVAIPDSVTTIGNGAFRMNALTSIEIPNSVITIGDSAFEYNQLTNVIIGTGVTTIGQNAFKKTSSNNSITTITNKTGRKFNWKLITNGSSAATFVTGTIPHSAGNITVTSE